ncbi:MAG: HAD family phosphatase [bacterium]|nr:MAG: HAD family phosphatase [bacterium]
MVVTDLDGTLLNPQQQISDEDLQSLKLLGNNKIYRVIATGRSLYSLNKVLPPDFPIDCLIFSSGAGIINWNTKEILYAQSLKPDEVEIIANLLIEMSIDFMIHKPIPDNHHFFYYQTGNENLDFERRIKIYEKFAQPLKIASKAFGSACQLLAIIPNDISIYESIKNRLTWFKVIRTTSPLDGTSIWVEIFPEAVSKGSAAAYLCQRLGCSPDSVLGIGNDYNDLDLLNWTEHSVVVENAPYELKQKFEITDSNANSGFTKAVQKKFKYLLD